VTVILVLLTGLVLMIAIKTRFPDRVWDSMVAAPIAEGPHEQPSGTDTANAVPEEAPVPVAPDTASVRPLAANEAERGEIAAPGPENYSATTIGVMVASEKTNERSSKQPNRPVAVKTVTMSPARLTTPPVLAKTEPTALKNNPAPPVIAKAPQPPAMQPVPARGQLKSFLLAGRWNSQGKPAALLPSLTTHCKSVDERIRCWSVPRKTETSQGPTIYKIQATLQDFSTEGRFQIAYRTQIKLVGDDTVTEARATAGDDQWQITTEHPALECQLMQIDKIQCRDEKGIARNYERSGAISGRSAG
jgi:hypothetical protein